MANWIERHGELVQVPMLEWAAWAAESTKSPQNWKLMRRVARITKGGHYHVSGNAAGQREELRQVFLKIATQRPVQLVD